MGVCFEEPEWWPGGQVSHDLNAKGNSLPTAGTGSPLPIHKEHGGVSLIAHRFGFKTSFQKIPCWSSFFSSGFNYNL